MINQSKCVEMLRTITKSGQKRLMDLSESEASLPRAPGKWSPKEVIGHLVDSAINNYARFASAEDTNELSYNGYHQEEWVIRGRYNEMRWKDLVILWSSLNLQLSRLIAGIPENIYNRKRSIHNLNKIAWQTIDEKEATSLAYFVRDYIGHLEHHLWQIWTDYKKIGNDYSNS